MTAGKFLFSKAVNRKDIDEILDYLPASVGRKFPIHNEENKYCLEKFQNGRKSYVRLTMSEETRAVQGPNLIEWKLAN